ncbi:hypothetical protein [Knoellia aerolata]|uniref:Ig-like domain-containing protein n=1 Tax=Knoellia aerolata DSM 18566 TaxID=1385519 RepID=A0A0A0K288_9MICO|nr:hypothetical protein [Knoellia aerolata]KGN43129.1 hypothetical protein N801_05140 [Knoellia aerolata DSM 18566]
MATKTQNITRAALVGVTAATLGIGAAASASGAPDTWLPNATLTCGSTTLAPSDWVAVPPSDSLWILTGDLAGHYVILRDAHYLATTAEQAAQAPATDYAGLPELETRSWGTKAGLTGSAFTCDFSSQWGDGGEGTEWIVGPVTIARAPGSSR